eukprot:gene11095-3161_t
MGVHSVAVVGAGAAGLAAARRLMQKFENVVVFEASSHLGGTWDYTSSTADYTHSSMYRDLHTNLPKQIMAFPEFPFETGKGSFVHRSDVQQYLESFASFYQIDKIVRCNTIIETIACKGEKWTVSTRHSQNGVTETLVFDAIAICNGHYSKPFVPEIKGFRYFSGQVMHSHTYRVPEPFFGKKVLCVGGGQSGRDISQELCSVAKSVILSHNKSEKLGLSPLIERPEIQEITKSGKVIFQDESQAQIDTIIFCTGYQFCFPFLDSSCNITVSKDGRIINTLYKHVFNVSYPTMAFIGIPLKVVPFPMFDLQCSWVCSVWSGKTSLPSQQEMEQHESRRRQLRVEEGLPERYAHIMTTDEQWEYNRQLSQLAGVPPLETWREAIYRKNNELRSNMPWHYKLNTFDVKEDNKTWSVDVFSLSE